MKKFIVPVGCGLIAVTFFGVFCYQVHSVRVGFRDYVDHCHARGGAFVGSFISGACVDPAVVR